MNKILSLFPKLLIWGGGLFISVIFIDSLRFKFAGHQTPEHIFTTLRDWSGIGLFYPVGPWAIGLGELLSSLLLIGIPIILFLVRKTNLIGKSQFLGAFVAFGVMSGAIIFHLFTPLGISTPVEWAGDTPTKFSNALFYSACVSWSFAVIIMILRKESFLRS